MWIHGPTHGALLQTSGSKGSEFTLSLQPQTPAHALHPALDLGVCSSSLSVLRREQNTSAVLAFQSSLSPDSSVPGWTRCCNLCV